MRQEVRRPMDDKNRHVWSGSGIRLIERAFYCVWPELDIKRICLAERESRPARGEHAGHDNRTSHREPPCVVIAGGHSSAQIRDGEPTAALFAGRTNQAVRWSAPRAQ